MTHPLTHNLICPKAVHQMSRRRHLPKLPIHPGDANVLGLRYIFLMFAVPVPLTVI